MEHEDIDRIEGERRAVDRLRSKASDAKRDLREMGDLAREAARERVEDWRTEAERMGEVMRDSIREQPMKSVLVAAGVGVLLGFLIRR